MLLTAILIKLDSSGPVFFSYHVLDSLVGRSVILSFAPCAIILTSCVMIAIMSQQVNLRSGTPMIKIKDDPRITRIGKIIRRLALMNCRSFF
jgi:lipopolysaccharide/colanic/teichoic acid biosynthesis glycosyltransferase